MGTIHPNLMTPSARLEEVAEILALGMQRLWKRQKDRNYMDLGGFPRMYAMDGNKEEKPHERQYIE